MQQHGKKINLFYVGRQGLSYRMLKTRSKFAGCTAKELRRCREAATIQLLFITTISYT